MLDVLVVGAGPAGLSCALNLARRGFHVSVADATKGNGPEGETLPPPVKRALAAAGFLADGAGGRVVECFGIQARWGGEEHFHSHILDAEGNGWHVRRDVFRSTLLHEARLAGVGIESAMFRTCRRQDDGWAVVLNEKTQVCCRFIVDATGRHAAVARRLGASRRRLDALCGVTAVFQTRDMPQTLCVESTRFGWWYVAPVSANAAMACLISDVDLVKSIGASKPDIWLSLFAQTNLPGINDALRGAYPLRVLPCETSTLTEVSGDRWVAVGDAASVFDPIASAGVVKALHTGRLAAEAIVEWLRSGTADGLNAYRQTVTAELRSYLVVRSAQYRLEKRWELEPFWQRRSFVASHGGRWRTSVTRRSGSTVRGTRGESRDVDDSVVGGAGSSQ